MAARHEEGFYEKDILIYSLVWKGLSNDGVGVAKGTVFKEIRPGSKPAISPKETLGGHRRTTRNRNATTAVHLLFPEGW